jgi:hypothetical protein
VPPPLTTVGGSGSIVLLEQSREVGTLRRSGLLRKGHIPYER